MRVDLKLEFEMVPDLPQFEIHDTCLSETKKYAESLTADNQDMTFMSIKFAN